MSANLFYYVVGLTFSQNFD